VRVMTRKRARGSAWVRNRIVAACQVCGMGPLVRPAETAGPRPGQALPRGLVHMPRRRRRLMRVELGRQGPQVVQVLALEPTLQLGEGDPAAERVHHVLGIRAIQTTPKLILT
jgi:hypothetical protein